MLAKFYLIFFKKTNNYAYAYLILAVVYFLNKYTIKMRMGGISNKNIQNIFLKMKEDLNIMKKFKLNVFKCIFVKNFSKIKQFF